MAELLQAPSLPPEREARTRPRGSFQALGITLWEAERIQLDRRGWELGGGEWAKLASRFLASLALSGM